MTTRYIYLLLSASVVFGAASAQAQVKQPAKKTPAKTTTKPVAKAVAKPAAKRLGDAAAKAKQDTTKKGGANAANQPSNNNALSEEIVVTTVYKPVLAEAVKIRRNPSLDDTEPYKAPLSYTTLDKKLERNSEIRQLEAMKMPAERDSIPANNFVRAGFGSLKTLFGEAYINNGNDPALQTGAFLKYFGQSGNVYKQNQAKAEAGVFGKVITGSNALSGRIDYNRRDNYFYGYNNPGVSPTVNPAKQHFNTLSAEGELAKNYQDTDRVFTYALKLNGYTFSDAYKARENNVVFTGFLNQTINQFYAGLGASLDLSTQKDISYSINNSLLRLNPYLKFQGDNYKIDAGINFVKEFGFSSRVFLFPAAKLELQVIPKYARLFVEAKGDVNKSSLRNWSEINPFMSQDITIKNSVDKLDVTIGLKGRIIAGLGFKASVFRNTVKDLPLFVSNFDQTTRYNRFNILYANGTTKISGFNGELDYKASDDLDIFGRVEFRDYQLNNNQQPWNLPKFNLTAGTAIHINKKVDINGSLVLRGTRADQLTTTTGDVVSTNQVTLKSFADLNGGVTYKATKQLSVFVQANNILNSNYQTWLYYPNYGFNIFGGAGFSF